MLFFASALTNSLLSAGFLLLVILGPLLFFTWLIHLFEKLIQRRLSARFGWNSVMLTGWLGTPVHELSHALMCAIFQHDIVEMELFKPDKRNGRLGYVIHRYQPGNLYQEVGNFFIGMAPLAGGAVSLMILLMVFFPDLTRSVMFQAGNDQAFWSQIADSVRALVTGLFATTNLASIKLWIFLYLVVCVGSHMAPSWSDYEGGIKGGLLLGVGLVLLSVVIAIAGPDSSNVVTFLKPVLIPLITLLVSVLALCGIATLIVFLITELYDFFTNRNQSS